MFLLLFITNVNSPLLILLTPLDTNNLQLHLDICTVVDDLLLVLGVPVPVGPDAVLVLEAPAETVPAHGLPQTRTGEH